ncbi:DUF1415 domain-containing protein [soil metagenome]
MEWTRVSPDGLALTRRDGDNRAMTENHQTIIDSTRNWVERAVIGLNLCPFAKAVHVKGQIRYVVSDATTEEELLAALIVELERLQESPPELIETTLLIHPQVLQDFMAYNDFLELADTAVEELELDGEIQVASFHPHYQFDGTGLDDMENFSNRSPYPTLHLLRESSVERAVAEYPDTDTIYERNIETLERLGTQGWNDLWSKPRQGD